MRYIVILPAITMTAMFLIMLILIRTLSNAAIEYDIKQELGRDIRQNLQYVTFSNGTLDISDGFSFKSDNVYFLLLDQNGTILAGQYPTEDFIELPGKFHTIHSVISHGGKYYVRDTWITKSNDVSIFMRGIVKKTDVYSRYRTIELLSYLSIIGVFLGIVLCEFFLSRRISNELKKICQTAENIGSNLNMSQRLEYHQHFYEIATLVEANNRMLDRMEQNFQQQEQFTSDVAHELRTPIAIIMAECQHTRETANIEKDFDESIDVIYRQSQKIYTLITQLLNFSRLTSDQTPIQQESLDLIEIVQSVCEEQADKIKNDVSIKTYLQEAYTTGDIHLILIVIQNLITNAIKFSYEHGQIEIYTGRKDDQVFVSVTDHGIGISPKELPHIFQRFYKCDKSRNMDGFGLGLPLSMKIAQKHGGTITVSSQPQKGSTFTLYLPKAL